LPLQSYLFFFFPLFSLPPSRPPSPQNTPKDRKDPRPRPVAPTAQHSPHPGFILFLHPVRGTGLTRPQVVRFECGCVCGGKVWYGGVASLR
jgi:hypothetical protein